MPTARKTAARKTAAPAPVAHEERPPIPAPSAGCRPAGFKLGDLAPAQRPDDTPIRMQGWISPDGAIAVQYATSWRPDAPKNAARYVVSAIVRGRAWVITSDAIGFGRKARPHSPSTIRALAGAIAARVAADRAPWIAMQDEAPDGYTVPPRAVEAFRKQIADLIY